MSADAHALIGAYILDAVDETERRLVEAHLTECPSCRQEAAELREAAWRLSDTTITEPPYRLRDSVLAEARRTRQEAPYGRDADDPGPAAGVPPSVPRQVSLPRRALALAAAVVLVAFVGGAVAWALMRQSGDTGPSGSDQIASVLEAADAEIAVQEPPTGGKVTVTYSEALDQAVVVVSGLASVGEDRSYQVWLVDAAGQISAGVMDPGDSSSTMLVEGIDDADLIGITNEPAGGSQAPTLPLVADVELSS